MKHYTQPLTKSIILAPTTLCQSGERTKSMTVLMTPVHDLWGE